MTLVSSTMGPLLSFFAFFFAVLLGVLSRKQREHLQKKMPDFGCTKIFIILPNDVKEEKEA